MTADVDAELAELRRRAYSRDGTADDLRRLAAREAAPNAADPVEPAVEDPALEPEPEPQPRVDERRRPAPSRRLVLISGGIGLLAGATVATLGILAPGREQADAVPPDLGPTALAVFDRAPTDRDVAARLSVNLDHVLPGGVATSQLRWLGEVVDTEVYVARGTFEGVTTICLIAELPDGGAASCTEESDFVVRGLTLGTNTLDLRWGPLGTEIWVADEH